MHNDIPIQFNIPDQLVIKLIVTLNGNNIVISPPSRKTLLMKALVSLLYRYKDDLNSWYKHKLTKPENSARPMIPLSERISK